jgi:DNA-binding transcriptional LysR family regulator
VEVRHFATLAAVADTGSFREAASRRGYVPSSVSQQISELERLVGDRLVQRRRGQRQVELTPAGSQLAERGRSVLASFEAAQVDLEAVSEDVREIRLAISRALVDVLLPPIARALDGLPGAVLVVDERDDDEDPGRQTLAGIADLGVGAFPVPGPEVEAVVLAEDPYELVVRGPVDRTPLTRDRLAAMRLVIPSAGRQVASRLDSLGLARPRALVADPADVAALVRAGLGVGVVTRSMRWSDEEGLIRVAAHHVLGTRAIAGMWHRRRRSSSEAVARFTRALPRIRSALAARLDVDATTGPIG